MFKKIIIFIALLSAIFGIYYLYYSPVATSKTNPTDSRIRVVVTTSFIADAVLHIARDRVDLVTLMGPGVDPHLYRAKKSDLQRLQEADLILFHGLHLEGKMAEMLERLAYTKPAYAVSDIVPVNELLPSDYQGLYDPHIWFDPVLWLLVVEYIGELLQKHDPDNAAYYKDNLTLYVSRIKEAMEYIVQKINTIPHDRRYLLTAHDAFAYFGKRYDFMVSGLQGISTDSEVSTADIMNMADFIIEKRIPVLYAESTIPVKSIQAVQEAVAMRGHTIALGDTLYSDSLGQSGSGTETYVDLLYYTASCIASYFISEESVL